jgi:hypothetical protein
MNKRSTVTVSMSRSSLLVLLLVSSLLVPAAAQVWNRAENAFNLAVGPACQERGVVGCEVVQVSEQQLEHNLMYYRALIKVGPGDFDVIALNRIIRKPHAGVLPPTAGSFFFIHGSSEDFRQVMVTPHGGGLGVFLAKRNIDVWGLDLRNVQIPAGTTDLSFAKNWGLDVQIKDVMLATRIARKIRGVARHGTNGIFLGGHSSGGALTFAVANAEAILPEEERDVTGIIPMDMPYKLPPWATDQGERSCFIEQMMRNANEAGFILSDNAATIAWAKLAQTDPDAVSTYAPPLTNLQFAMENAGALFQWPIYPFHPWAVVRDSAGIAIAGRYTKTSEILQNFATSPVYPIPNGTTAEIFGVSCPTTDSPYDDNLGMIEVPVLYIGAAGGFGQLAEYTTQLLGSKDITNIMIQLQPGDDVVNDYGHMDPLTADEAPRNVWEPIHAWLVSRSH